MCGRTSLFLARSDLEERFDATFAEPERYRPRYNIAPTAPLEVLRGDGEIIERFHWGIPSGGHRGHINARIESVAERPTFAEAWRTRPCLIPSTGFYEWADRPGESGSQPYRLHLGSGDAFAMGGIYEPTADGPTAAILTREASRNVRPIHDRMPVVLRRDVEREWLAGSPDRRAKLAEMAVSLEAYPIVDAVNDPNIDDDSIIDPLGHEQTRLEGFDQP